MQQSQALTTGAAPAATPDYVDDRTLAVRTPISRVQWQVMRREGKGPAFYRIGRRCVYRWAEVMAWLEGHRVEALRR
jgi:hypothetical protein